MSSFFLKKVKFFIKRGNGRDEVCRSPEGEIGDCIFFGWIYLFFE